MSKLISGKEAAIAYLNGEDVQHINSIYAKDESKARAWGDCEGMPIDSFLSEKWVFRIKPKTTVLNGIQVEQLFSTCWSIEDPRVVALEFHSEDAARDFHRNALKIFNGI